MSDDVAGPPARRPTSPEDFPATGPYSIPSILQRAAARVLDALLIGLPIALALLGEVRIEGDEVVLDEIPAWVVPAQIGLQIVYETVAVALWGRTLGKLLLGLRVSRFVDGKRPTWTQSAQRIVLPSVPGALPFEGAGFLEVGVYLTSVLDPLRRGWHDRYAGTVVLRTR